MKPITLYNNYFFNIKEHSVELGLRCCDLGSVRGAKGAKGVSLW